MNISPFSQSFFFLILLLFSLISACQIEDLDKTKAAEAAERVAAKRAVRVDARKEERRASMHFYKKEEYPKLKSLKISKKPTIAAILSVNGIPVFKGKKPVTIDTTAIFIEGLAVDKPFNKACKGAIIQIGKKIYPVDNWVAKRSFATNQENENYMMSGYEVTIDAADLEKGQHVVTLYVLSVNKRHYYKMSKTVLIEIV